MLVLALSSSSTRPSSCRASAARAPTPVEVIPFGVLHTLGHIRGLFDGLPGFHARLRSVPATAAKGKEDSKQSFVTDNDNYIIEDGIRGDLHDISDRLFQITGVVEHDMFLDPRLIFPR